MYKESTKCKSCDPLNANGENFYCQDCFKDAIRVGFAYALDQYGIYRNGVQVIGCMETDIKVVMKRFDEEHKADSLVKAILRGKL